MKVSPELTHEFADWAAIATFVVGIFGYLRYLCGLHKKSNRLEAYLRSEKEKEKDRGQRSIIQIIRDVGLTEDEIIQVSFRNSHVGRRVKIGQDGLATQLLFEYQD